MDQELRVEVRLADSKVSVPARLAFENFDDPLLGFEDPLLGFEDPLLGMEKLIGRTSKVLIGRTDKSSLNVRSERQEKPAFALHLEPGPDADRLLERFGTEQQATLTVTRAGEGFRVVINHEEQFSRPRAT